jgi:hypothetical protein
MIQEILLQTLPQVYGLHREQIALKTEELTGNVALSDTARCANCKTKQSHPCEEQNMRMNVGTASVTLVDHESYIKQFNGTQLGRGKNCDYMLVDDSGSNYKVAFCDLTCSLAKSVEPDEGRTSLPEGTRAKVMVQLEESVRRFANQEATKTYLEGFQHRHCIFGWRDPFVTDSPITPRRGDVAANMMIMGAATSGSEPLLLQHRMISGLEFVFYQVKYPTVYQW